jgi:hypothetical protein
MTEHEITALLDPLVERFDDETGDWEGVLERAADRVRGEPRRARRRWPRRLSGRGRGLPLFAATAAVTALVLLAATAPWRGGPSVLERAAAAIASPGPGKILYESITIRATPKLPPGRVPRRVVPGHLGPPYVLIAHVDVWMADTPPRRFRLTEDASLSGRLQGNARTVGLGSTEIGSTVGGVQGLAYDTVTRALDPVRFASRLKRSQVDVTEFIWQAITSGRAKVDGRAVLDGRPVVRIRVLVHGFGRVVSDVLYYVDATTYRPVRVEMTNDEPLLTQTSPGFPLLTLTPIQTASLPDVPGRYVLDFDAYRYLTPTPANERLTRIRAAHPRAKIV